MATINIANLTFTHKGNYDGSTAYVKNDVVYYATNGNAYIAKQGTTGNVPTNGTYWSQFAAGSGGIWNAGLSIGSAGQVVKVNSGASALEFGDAEGQIVKITTFTNSTRTVLNATPTGTIFDNIAVTKVKDANTSKIIAIGMMPGEFHASYHSAIYFVCKTTGMDNSGSNDTSAFYGIGQSYGTDSDSPGMMHVNKVFEDTTNLGVGTHNFKIGWRDRNGGNEKPADVINHNNTDDNRAQQAGTFIQFMEVLR